MPLCAIHSRLRAGALFYALLLATIAAIILTALIASWAYFHYDQQKNNALTLHIDHLVSGFNYLLGQPFSKNEVVYEGHFTSSSQEPFAFVENATPSFGSQSSHATVSSHASTPAISLTSQPWGLLQILSAQIRSTIKEFPQQHRTALVGYAPKNGPSVILPNNRQPLTFTGNSFISGDIQVGNVRLPTASYNGQAYSGRQPLRAGRQLPNKNAPASEYYKKISILKLDGETTPVTSQVFQQSFRASTLKLPRTKIRALANVSLTGKILVTADSLISVDRSAYLEDVILIAPIIEIAAGFTGSFQAFATKKITIGQAAQLNFPTYLCLDVPTILNRNELANIKIGRDVQLAGAIYANYPSNGRIIPQLIAGPNASITGTINFKGGVNIQGKLSGQIIAENFFFRDGQRERINYLHNFQLQSPIPFTPWTASRLEPNDQKAIAKWID